MTDAENHAYLFECSMAELSRWRLLKLIAMEKTINAMMQKELERRIKSHG